jgi:hypothetical protein
MPEPTLGSDSDLSPAAVLRELSAQERISPEQLAAVARLQDYWRSRIQVSGPGTDAAPAFAADSTPADKPH